jgi:hypothetical protein
MLSTLRFEPDAQGIGQLIGRAGVQRPDGRDHAGVVDQRGTGQAGRVELGQPVLQALGRGHGVGQVDAPLQQRGTALARQFGEFGAGLARQAEQNLARCDELSGHGQAHAAGGAGEDEEVVHGGWFRKGRGIQNASRRL